MKREAKAYIKQISSYKFNIGEIQNNNVLQNMICDLEGIISKINFDLRRFVNDAETTRLLVNARNYADAKIAVLRAEINYNVAKQRAGITDSVLESDSSLEK